MLRRPSELASRLDVAIRAAKAADILLIEEAGGRCTDYCGQPPTEAASSVVASNRSLHDAMLKLVEAGCHGRS